MIRILRGICVVFLFILFGTGALILRYLIFPFQKSTKQNYETLYNSWRLFIFILKKLKIIELEINDIEKIKNIKNSIIISTHPSFIDIVILMSIIPYSTCFVANKLTKNLFFKGIVELLFIADNGDIEQWLNDSNNKLNEGLNLIIFPMGTRHKENEYLKIKRGTALIAQKSQKNIIALNIKTDAKFLQNNQPIYDANDKAVKYKIDYLGEINTMEYLEKYSDSITFKTEITKLIAKILYNKM